MAYISYEVTEADKQLMFQPELKYMIKIEILDRNYKILDQVEGMANGGSYNIDSTSDIRRTTSFTVIPVSHSDKVLMRIAPDSYIWFDKIIHYYIGLMDISTGEYTYYSEGYYQYMSASSNYDKETNQLTLQLNDYMCTLDGSRNGQVGTPVIIPSYEFEENNDGTINIVRYNNIRDAMKATLIDMAHIPANKIFISEMGATNALAELQENYKTYRSDYPYWASVPYDLEFAAGASTLQIVNELRDLYPNFETFFSPDVNNFICQLIPSHENDRIMLTNDFLQRILISEQSSVSLTEVKNVCEVWGKVLNPKYYAAECNKTSESILNCFDPYYQKLITSVVDNGIILDLTMNIQTDITLENQLSAQITATNNIIAQENATISSTLSDIGTYETYVGKHMSTMKEGKTAVNSNTAYSYTNFNHVYTYYNGYLNSTYYDRLLTLLYQIILLGDTSNVNLWLQDISTYLTNKAGTDQKNQARANTTYQLVNQLVQTALSGALNNYRSMDLISNYVAKYYKDKIYDYDDDNKTAFIKKISILVTTKGYALYTNTVQVEMGTWGQQLYTHYCLDAQYQTVVAGYEDAMTHAQLLINSYSTTRSEYANTLNATREQQQRLLSEAAKYSNLADTFTKEVANLLAQIENAKSLERKTALLSKVAEFEERATQCTKTSLQLKTEASSLANTISNLEKQINSYDVLISEQQAVYDANSNAKDSYVATIVDPNTNTIEYLERIIDTRHDNDLATAIELYNSTVEAKAEQTQLLAEYTDQYNQTREQRLRYDTEKSAVVATESTIRSAYNNLRQYIAAHLSDTSIDIQDAQILLDSFESLYQTYPDYFKDYMSSYDNLRILLNQYKTSISGANLFTYNITLDGYQSYDNGDAVAIKINIPNDSPSTYLRINALSIVPIYRTKKMTDEAALNNFIERDSLKGNHTYVFMINNISTTKSYVDGQGVTHEYEETSTYAFLQGSYQLHGIDVLSDGRELTEYYMVQQRTNSSGQNAITTDNEDWSEKRALVADGLDSSSFVDNTLVFDNNGDPVMVPCLDEDNNPIYKYSRKYFERKYNCDNIHFTYVPDSPYTVEKLGEILDVKNGDRYNNCIDDTEIVENAIYENWKNSRLTDTITITTLLCPFLDVNIKVSYKPRIIQINNLQSDNPDDDEPYIYIIKSINHDLSNMTSNITMYRFYPLFDPNVQYQRR